MLLLINFLDWQNEYLSARYNTQALRKYALENQNVLYNFSDEISLAIARYNEIFVENLVCDLPKSLFINAQNTHNMFSTELPCFSTLFTELTYVSILREKVFHELANSEYLKEVWELPIPSLLCNLLILVYRNAVIYSYPDLLLDPKTGERKVQISSTIEEMICLIQLTKLELDSFEHIKIWLEDWKNEGFSEKLIDLLKARNYL